MGFPQIVAKGFPSNLVDWYLAGIITTLFIWEAFLLVSHRVDQGWNPVYKKFKSYQPGLIPLIKFSFKDIFSSLIYFKASIDS